MEGRDFRKIEIVIEALRRHKEFQELLGGINPFLIYRTDTGAMLARGIYGFEQAKAKANELQKLYGLKWEMVKFKAERNSSGSYKRQAAEELITPPTTIQASMDGSRCESTQIGVQQILISVSDWKSSL